MVDVNVRTPQREPREMSERSKRRQERIARLQAHKPAATVRVNPANDEVRKLIKHPDGMAFRPEGSIEWPNDRFTKRRLAEGTVTLEETADKKRGSTPRTEKPQGAA